MSTRECAHPTVPFLHLRIPPFPLHPTCSSRGLCSTGQTDASASINACVAAAGGSSLALPPGTYLIASAAIDISASGFTLSTAGVDASAPGCGRPGSSPCATLRASAGLASTYGVLSVHDASNVTVDHIVMDGNRWERLTGPAGLACAAENGNRAIAYTAGIHNCDGCSLNGAVSMHAVCGTGLEFSGTGFTVTDSFFHINGSYNFGVAVVGSGLPF